MGQAIRDRGPDSDGIWSDAAAGYGVVHQRLSIVDISDTGHQPMVSASGRYVISFNGEIYNHRAIRQSLDRSAAEVGWRGTSDTETLLASVEQLGLDKAIDQWVGMFAFALWDRHTRTLTLGRDRFGEKPLYYGWHKGRFLFASELKALIASDGFCPRLDLDALTLYFRHHYVPAPYSIFQGVQKLQPGTLATLHYGATEPAIRTYWSAVGTAQLQSAQQFTGGMLEATDRVQSLLTRSVAAQAVADVPVGAFLSGGIDSTTVVALMQQAAHGRVKTFSVGFGEAAFNEAEYASAVARHLATDHTELYLDGAQARELIPDLPWFYDEPFADPSQLPTYVVSRLAREQVTVSLSGDGGDELFGGYTRYRQAAKVIRVRHSISSWGQSAARLLLQSPMFTQGPTGNVQPAWTPGALRGHLAPGCRAMELMAQQSDAKAYRDMLSFWKLPMNPVRGGSEPGTGYLAASNWLSSHTVSEAVQMLDVLNYLPDDILVKVDRAAMRVSLESRIPMLDHRLAEFVWSLPPDLCATAAQPKQILIDIASRFVPRSLIDRPKMGFGIPLADWLRGPLRDWAESLLDPREIEAQGYLDAGIVSQAWQSFLSGNNVSGNHIWSVLVFQAWHNELLSTHSLSNNPPS